MCDEPSTAVFCSECIECFPIMASTFVLKPFVITRIVGGGGGGGCGGGDGGSKMLLRRWKSVPWRKSVRGVTLTVSLRFALPGG